MENQGVLNLDAHMFMQEDFYQSEPNGLKEWGDTALAAAKSEMKQLHMRDTFKPRHWSELSHTQRQMVLESHMFLKQK